MNTAFNQSAIQVMQLKNDPTNEEMLEVYALYKQATKGDCNTPEPGMFNFRENAKWKAWNSKKGINPKVAQTLYIMYVEKLKACYGF
jgi:diazepam-binding inhibitor (GABA receptor modulating acyl-CoA-binding protein)